MVGGFFTALLVGCRILPQADAELARGLSHRGARRAWAVFVRYVVPPVLLVVLVFLAGAAIGAIRTLLGVW
jgi:SNF family Na+-dependent transporter